MHQSSIENVLEANTYLFKERQSENALKNEGERTKTARAGKTNASFRHISVCIIQIVFKDDGSWLADSRIEISSLTYGN